MSNDITEILEACEENLSYWRQAVQNHQTDSHRLAIAKANLNRAEKRLALAQHYQIMQDYGTLAQLYDEMQLNPFEEMP